LCALLSSVLVLNTKGTLNENVFNSLALTCRFAEHIEEKGQEASRPALLWVLRDFVLELRDGAGHPMTTDEYLEQALHAAPLAGSNPRGQAAKEVRQSLLQFFSHRSCMTLVQPAIDETQLQNLSDVPYRSLRGEFRAGVEALRTQLVATCHLNPKTVGGQVLGCASFVALMKQLVESLNEAKQLSVKGAWDAVQHTTCGGLAEELRGMALQKLKALKSGQKLPDGAELPMTDEALRAFFREQRHALKEHWEKQAVGDEEIRKEYWQELKETLAREELQIRQQNSRVADQQLQEDLQRWQEWLDDDNGAAAEGEKISAELGERMERMPATPLTRTSRTAVEAAARRVATARTAVSATVEQSAESQRRALAWGEQAAQSEGAVRSELDATKAAIREASSRELAASQAKEANIAELQGKCAESEDCDAQLTSASDDLEQAKEREDELQAQNLAAQSREASLRRDLEAARAMASKANADRELSKTSADESQQARERQLEKLQQELREARDAVQQAKERSNEELGGLKREHEALHVDHQKKVQELHDHHGSERAALQTAHESMHAAHQKLVESARRDLENMRKQHSDSKEGTKGQLLEHVRTIGTLEGKVSGLTSEASSLKDRIAELQAASKEADSEKVQKSQECHQLRSELDKAKAEADRARAEGEEKLAALRREGQKRLNERRERMEKQRSTQKGCMPFRASGGAAPAPKAAPKFAE